MKKILLLGSGELGKEFVIAAMRAGQYVIACDRYDNAPAMQVAIDRSLLDYNFVDALKEDRTRIRIFGKPEAHKGRRMGVVLCYGEVGDDTNALRDKAKRLAKTVLGTDPYTKFEH